MTAPPRRAIFKSISFIQVQTNVRTAPATCALANENNPEHACALQKEAVGIVLGVDQCRAETPRYSQSALNALPEA